MTRWPLPKALRTDDRQLVSPKSATTGRTVSVLWRPKPVVRIRDEGKTRSSRNAYRGSKRETQREYVARLSSLLRDLNRQQQ
jgi:hypothetical protein